jgi:hybrid cluster-associated redox disulfide protein
MASGPEKIESYRAMSVATVMTRWPSTIRVFLDWKMACVGCPVGRFHTLEEASTEHRADLAPFLRSVSQAIDAD